MNSTIDRLYDQIDRGVRVLYLYGPRRSGKTHLIHQIVKRYTSDHPSADVFFVNALSPIDKIRLAQADVVVLDEFDRTFIDETTLNYLRSAATHLDGRPRLVLIAGERNPAEESSSNFATRSLLNVAGNLYVQELLPARAGLSPELTIYIDPGSAPPEAVGELLSEISRLYRMIGGSGITFTNSGVAYPEGVL
jgi:hypothetical protein